MTVVIRTSHLSVMNLGRHCTVPYTHDSLPATSCDQPNHESSFADFHRQIKILQSQSSVRVIKAKLNYAIQVADLSQTWLPTWLSTRSCGSATSLRLFGSKAGRRHVEIARTCLCNRSETRRATRSATSLRPGEHNGIWY